MKYSKTFIGLFSLLTSAGCLSVRKTELSPIPVSNSIVKKLDPDLTLINKELPRYQSFSFERAELSFSTNKTQQAHAILSRHLCPDFIETIQKTPLGKTMRNSEWDTYLGSGKICPQTGKPHFNNWQKFYQ